MATTKTLDHETVEMIANEATKNAEREYANVMHDLRELQERVEKTLAVLKANGPIGVTAIPYRGHALGRDVANIDVSLAKLEAYATMAQEMRQAERYMEEKAVAAEEAAGAATYDEVKGDLTAHAEMVGHMPEDFQARFRIVAGVIIYFEAEIEAGRGNDRMRFRLGCYRTEYEQLLADAKDAEYSDDEAPCMACGSRGCAGECVR